MTEDRMDPGLVSLVCAVILVAAIAYVEYCG